MIQGGLCQYGVTIFATFALLYPHHHAFAVYVGYLQA
jgi:hypothetical protein